MGCDIHVQIEYKRDGKWRWVNEFLPEGLDKQDFIPISRDRNYNLFAILANVRNGYGFAGCDTGDGFVPISEPKGLPDDISKALQKEAEDGLLGDHSLSWLTAKELGQYNWDRKTKRRGWVTKKDYTIFKLTGKPESWNGGVSGPNVKHLTNEQMDAQEDNLENCYTQVEWETSCKDAVGWDVFYSYSNLRGLTSWDDDGKNIEDIRIVFGFDS